jgi:hypothetical protein
MMLEIAIDRRPVLNRRVLVDRCESCAGSARSDAQVTMTANAIPSHILQFVAENIDTVPELEALLLLLEGEARRWSEEEVAARVYVPRPVARNILETLRRRRLIAAEGDPPQYRYGPEQAGKRELIAEVANAYRLHLVPMTTFIHSKAPASVREFARAFDFKKDR